MIYTSYFANWRKFPATYKVVCIARYAPRGAGGRGSLMPVALELAPSEDLLFRYKNDKIGSVQYTLEFNEQLAVLNPSEIGSRYDNYILLCYEKAIDFCHRHLVRQWLMDHQIACQEL